jgi:ABC-type polysaccharide/polyol phosphate export permease
MVAYLADIWRLRYFWSSLVRIDLRNRYRRSVLGIGWSLLHPILMTAVLCAVFCPLFRIDYRQFAPYLLAGLAFWNFLVTTSTNGCHCFFQGEAYIRQQAAPLVIYPLRTVLGTAIHGVAALSVVLIFTWCMNGFGNLPALISLVPSLTLIFLLGWSLALCFGITNVIFQDTQHLTEVLFQILFYLTPVMYPSKLLAERRMDWLVRYNPLASFLELVRVPILEGQLPPWSAFATALGTVLVLLTAGTIAVSRLERRLIFYL